MPPLLYRLAIAAVLALSWAAAPAQAGKIVIAAAADLKFAMEELVADFRSSNKTDEIETVYGSSGKFYTQIREGAPYDLYFSADISYPRRLAGESLAASPVETYAFGRIVLWSSTRDASKLTLEDLSDSAITRIAIANPRHAPYGKRAEEALRAAGQWDAVEPKLVYGENIAQTAQFVETGNADVGIIALSLALSPLLAGQGPYGLIPESLHEPLEQGYIVTHRAADNPLAWHFAEYVRSRPARAIFERYGFTLPETPAVN
jgi:molybdate transport system substrate-binding protein